VEYLIAALQHHFKTAVPQEVEYFDEMTKDDSPLTDVGTLNQEISPNTSCESKRSLLPS